MADEKTQPLEEPKPTEEIIVRNDAPLKVIRGPKGTFCKQKTTMPKTQDVTRLLRNLMAQAEAGPDGKMRHGDKTRIRKMFDNIVSIASMPAEQPLFHKLTGEPMLDTAGRVVTVKDAKSAMASVQAFKELTARIYGQYAKSDEEIDALKTQGVKIVVISPPAEMMNREVKEDKPRPAPTTPAFAEVMEITNDK
jgi:hypothetical protein